MHALSTARIDPELLKLCKESQSFLLPELQSLSIENSQTLDKKPSQAIFWNTVGFPRGSQLSAHIEGKILTIDWLEGEEWLNEAEKCEWSW